MGTTTLIEVLLCRNGPHLNLIKLLAPGTPMFLFTHASRARLFQGGETEPFAMVRGTEPRAIIVNDVSGGLQARPADVVDAVNEDERDRDDDERDPEEEVVEE